MGRSGLALTVALALLSGCATRGWQAKFTSPQDPVLDSQVQYVKLHHADGGVTVLAEPWTWDAGAGVFTGWGRHYDALRTLTHQGDQRVEASGLVLVESTQPFLLQDASVPVMGIATGASLMLTAVCLANPKSCFGSCPTFYAETGDGLALQAEGFSDAIAPPLEHADVDALWTAATPDGPLDLVLTNEALESHYIRDVALIAVPRPEGGRVLRHEGRFLAASALRPASSCTFQGEDCTASILEADLDAWLAPSDPEDLGAQVSIEVVLPEPTGEAGVMVAGKQGLLTTFALYQVLAWMGEDAGGYISEVIRRGPDLARVLSGGTSPLSRLQVEAWDGTHWTALGDAGEVGPIAREVQVLPLPEDLPAGPVRVRLTGAAGGWRLDQIALAELAGEVEPVRIRPSAVLRADGAEEPEVLAVLLDPDRQLVHFPGDQHTLRFDLPETPTGEWELFVESRGYYIEWMRNQWMSEHDPERVAAFIRHPGAALRAMAPAYKAIEPEAERIFWESRVDLGLVPEGER